MKLRNLILALGLVFGTLILHGQDQGSNDIVTLKSGAVYQGKISEYLPGESLTIVLLDGRVKEINGEEIRNVSIAGTEHFTIKEKGYVNSSDFGLLIGNSTTGTTTSFMFNMVNGYKWKRSTFGVGSGFEVLLDEMFIPLYLDYQFNLLKGSFSPYVSTQLGYTFNPGAEEPEEFFYWYYPPDYHRGAFAGLEVGINNYISEKFGISMSVGYRYYKLDAYPYDRYLNADILYPVENNAMLHRAYIKFGILIN